MQPHSLAALQLGYFLWTHHPNKDLVAARITMEFTLPDGRSRNLSYTLNDFSTVREKNGFLTEFRVWVKRSGDPLSCYMRVRRMHGPNVDNWGVVMMHGTQHRSGLQEITTFLGRKLSGYHRNSIKYGNYNAEFSDDGKQVEFEGKLIVDLAKNAMKDIRYKGKIESEILKAAV